MDIISCNLCGGEDWEAVWTKCSPFLHSDFELLRNPQNFHIDKCQNCGLMQVRENRGLGNDYFEAMYSNRYFDAYGASGAYENHLKKRPFRWIAKVLSKRFRGADRSLLEIGCAQGGFLTECAALGWDVEGVDLSAAAVSKAREFGHNVHSGDFRHCQLDRDQYDAVVTLATLEHVQDPLAYLRAAAALIRPGGMLLLTTIDMTGLMPRLLGRRWAQVAPPHHLYYFEQAHLAKYLERAGLKPSFVGGKLMPATYYYRARPYRSDRTIWNVGYVLFLATKS